MDLVYLALAARVRAALLSGVSPHLPEHLVGTAQDLLADADWGNVLACGRGIPSALDD
jgi:hypothetical protein